MSESAALVEDLFRELASGQGRFDPDDLVTDPNIALPKPKPSRKAKAKKKRRRRSSAPLLPYFWDRR